MKHRERRLSALEARIPAKQPLDLAHMPPGQQARLVELAYAFSANPDSLTVGDLDELKALMLRARRTPRPSAGHGSLEMAEKGCCCSLCADHHAAALLEVSDAPET